MFAGMDLTKYTPAQMRQMAAGDFSPMQLATSKPTTAKGVEAEIMELVRQDLAPQVGVVDRISDYHRRFGSGNESRREHHRREFRAQSRILSRYFDSEESYVDAMIAEEGEQSPDPRGIVAANGDFSPGQEDTIDFGHFFDQQREIDRKATDARLTAPSGSGRGVDAVVTMVAAGGDDDFGTRSHEPTTGKIHADGRCVVSTIDFHGVR